MFRTHRALTILVSQPATNQYEVGLQSLMTLTRVTNETGSTSSDQFRSVYFSLFQFSSCAVNKRLVEAAAAAMTHGHVS